jgi:hypothetical protein
VEKHPKMFVEDDRIAWEKFDASMFAMVSRIVEDGDMIDIPGWCGVKETAE